MNENTARKSFVDFGKILVIFRVASVFVGKEIMGKIFKFFEKILINSKKLYLKEKVYLNFIGKINKHGKIFLTLINVRPKIRKFIQIVN